MAEKRILIVDADVAQKVDENRGELSRSDFINLVIDSRLKDEPAADQKKYVSQEEFQDFAAGMRELLRNFLEFFLSYGLELGKQPQDKEFLELTAKLQALANSPNKK